MAGLEVPLELAGQRQLLRDSLLHTYAQNKKQYFQQAAFSYCYPGFIQKSGCKKICLTM